MQSVEDNLAVIDIGKTSAKILCFDRGGNLINDTRLKPNWIVNNGISELNVDHYWNWIMDSLEVFYDEAGEEQQLPPQEPVRLLCVRSGPQHALKLHRAQQQRVQQVRELREDPQPVAVQLQSVLQDHLPT